MGAARDGDTRDRARRTASVKATRACRSSGGCAGSARAALRTEAGCRNSALPPSASGRPQTHASTASEYFTAAPHVEPAMQACTRSRAARMHASAAGQSPPGSPAADIPTEVDAGLCATHAHGVRAARSDGTKVPPTRGTPSRRPAASA